MKTNFFYHLKRGVLGCAASVALTVLLITGCGMLGANPKPPTKVEGYIFNTVTSTVPVIVPSYITNQVVVTQTNVQGVTVFQTNVVPVTVPATTNLAPAYADSLKPGVAQGIGAASAVANTIFPGAGTVISIVGNGVLGLLTLLAYGRSTKNANTAGVLAQNVQVARQLLQSLPNGAALDQQFTSFIQNHQADEGVLQQVIALVASKVSNSNAQTAAQQITLGLQALQAGTAPATATQKV